MKKLLRRYLFFIILLAANIALLFVFPESGPKSIRMTGQNMLEMLSIVPPVFILLGLLDVWVKRETMIKIMGEKSSWIGVLVAFFLGSCAAGPLYASFPVAGMLMKKGSKFSNVLIFTGAWSTTKIPLLLFEASAMGPGFMLTRLAVDIPVIILIAVITEKVMKKQEIEAIYAQAEKMG
jgi:uncharacterized membrane protein YraQ (UPF0718 family)